MFVANSRIAIHLDATLPQNKLKVDFFIFVETFYVHSFNLVCFVLTRSGFVTQFFLVFTVVFALFKITLENLKVSKSHINKFNVIFI